MNIVKYILIILGIFEVLSNLFHISKGTIGDIGKSAKRQHQELPVNIPDHHFFYKAIIMLLFGVLFLAVGVFGFLNLPFSSVFIWFTVICFGLYGIVQALIYKSEIKVWIVMIVHNIPLMIIIFFK